MEENEDYNYENKKLSRKEILKYIKEKHQKFKFRPFQELKLIILSHIKGSDLEEIYYPLGLKRENITVVERDKEVLEQMRKNPLFYGTTIINKDLKEIIHTDKFDIYHLDFKANIHLKLFYEVIYPFLFYNQFFYSKNNRPSIFYFNFFGARETKKTTDTYHYLEEALNKIKKDGELNISALKNNINKTSTQIKKPTQFFNLFDNLSRLKDLTKNIELLFRTEEQRKSSLHFFRSDFLYTSIKAFLDANILRYLPHLPRLTDKDIKNLVHNKRYIEKARYLHNTTTFLFYLTNYPQIYDYYSFKYLNRKNNPFISSLFVLSNISEIIRNESIINKYFEYEMDREFPTLTSILPFNEINKRFFVHSLKSNIKVSTTKLKSYFKTIFENKGSFIISAIMSFYGISKYLKKEIPYSSLISNFQMTYENLYPDKSSVSIMTHDHYLMVLKIYKILKNNNLLSFKLNKKIAEITLSWIHEIPLDHSYIAGDFTEFAIGIDILSKVNGMLEMENKIFELRDISKKADTQSYTPSPKLDNVNKKKKKKFIPPTHPTLYIRVHSELDKEILKELSQEEKKKRDMFALKYLEIFNKDGILSLDISLNINRKYLELNRKLPFPLFSEFEIRWHKARNTQNQKTKKIKIK